MKYVLTLPTRHSNKMTLLIVFFSYIYSSIISVIVFLVVIATIGELVHLNLKHIRTYVPKLKNKKKESNEDIVRSEINISVEQTPSKKDDNESETETKKKMTAKES